MAFTYQNLVDEALQLIGVLEPGNSFSTAQYADLTRTLQLMLDEWNAQYSLQRTTAGAKYTLTAGRSVYTIGPSEVSPNWTGAKPTQITQANVLVGTGTTTQRYPLQILTYEEAFSISPIDQANAPYPTTLYYGPSVDGQTSGFFIFNPTPTAPLSVELSYPGALPSAVALTDTVFLPVAYPSAITYNLAVRLAPKYGKAPRQDLIVLAATSLQNVRASVNRPLIGVSTGRTVFDRTQGEYVRIP
jgi:hypothetical protein